MSYPNPTSGGPPLRALAMVLIALAIVFAGLGAMSLSSSDSDASGAEEDKSTGVNAASQIAAGSTTAAATASTTASGGTTAATTTGTTTTGGSTVNRSVPVRVLNNSLVVGLAARTASELSADGWTNVSAGNYSGGNVAKTTVYYGSSAGEREAAVAIAKELGATAEPKSGFGDSAPGVVVILAGN